MAEQAKREGTSHTGPLSNQKAPLQSGPQPGSAQSSDDKSALLQLLAIEAEAREAKNQDELLALIANEGRKLTRARQIFVLRYNRTDFTVAAVSGLASVDRTVPLIQWVERTMSRVSSELGAQQMREFNISAFSDTSDQSAKTYPMPEALWVPFLDRSAAVIGGMLLTRESPWIDRDSLVAERLAGTFGHAWLSLTNSTEMLSWLKPGKRAAAIAASLFAFISVVPVSLTTLAPAEVGPSASFIVAAPIDGVIEVIPIDANAVVKKGDVLLRFTDTMLRNRLEVAEREVLVAEARLKTTTQIAFSDIRGKHELAIVRAELALKTAERDYARDILAKTVLRAERDGVAVFASKNELVGRPVAVGERLLEIADPAQVEFRIDVPVADAIILREGARVKVFLDSDPLRSAEATVVRSDYIARVNDGVQLSFRVVAKLEGSRNGTPRLGARGTAQIYGDKVALLFYLLRRPFSTIRQWTGL